MKKTKILLRDLKDLDASSDNCHVRLIEMIVDSIADFNCGITRQFWNDCQLYGLDEAVQYLRGYCPKNNFTELDAAVADVKLKMTY